jgi:hypothetical protein
VIHRLAEGTYPRSETFFSTLRRLKAKMPLSIKPGHHGVEMEKKKKTEFLKIFFGCNGREFRNNYKITFTEYFPLGNNDNLSIF